MRFILLSLLFLCTPSIHAEIYKWTDERGKVHFSDQKPRHEKQAVEQVEVKVNTYKNVSFDENIFGKAKKVILYSTSWCTYCKRARAYFKQHRIKYTEYDIEKNARAKREFDSMGAKAVPIILVGKKRMNGFSEDKFARFYEKQMKEK